MPGIYAGRAAGTAIGYDATIGASANIKRAMGKAIGFPAYVGGPAPSANAAPDALRLEILDSAGTQIVNDLVKRRNLTFTVEHNGSGSVTFETDLSTFAAGIDDAALAEGNLIRVHYGDLSAWPYGIAEGLIASVPPVKDDEGRWTVTVSCPGTWDVLDYGVLWPPLGATGDTREFSYTAGQTGPAWVPEEWGKPSGYLVKNSFRWKHRYPRGWPDEKAYWVWSPSPEKASGGGGTLLDFLGAFGILETRKIVLDAFTLTAKTAVHFYAAGDDTLKLYLNGARLKTKGRGAWHRTASFIRTLKAGTYVVSAEVANLAGSEGKCGFIFAAAALKANGTRDYWLVRTSPSTCQIKTGGGYFAQAPLPPDGWYPPAVLHTHVAEAAARGVEYHSTITQTFTTASDSAGSGWTVKGQSEYDIGISGAELGEKVRSSGVDAAMLPGLRLSAWRSRGADLRDHVAIAKPDGVGYSSRTWSRVRSVALTRHESGWAQTNGDVAISTAYGRRELTISGGGTDGDAQADALAAQALSAAASPEETISVTINSGTIVTDPDTGFRPPQPFVDFNVADIVSMETNGGFVPAKVMSIAGAEKDDKTVDWTIAGYPV